MDSVLTLSITAEAIEAFARELRSEEKGASTQEYYLRTARRLMAWLDGRPVDKGAVIAWKEQLEGRGYKPRSINTMIAAANRFLSFLGREDCRVRSLRCQQRSCDTEGRELSRAELDRLVAAAQQSGNRRLALLLDTLSSTGLRVSELRFITVEAVRQGTAQVKLKGKSRPVVLTEELCRVLRPYIAEQGIETGPVFVTRSGKPLSRTNIWKAMKGLCKLAKVDERKVFPHNLRHLFARVFYSIERDLVKLASILGHSSINTTRIYIMSTLAEHRAQLERMHLVHSGGKRRKKKAARKAAKQQGKRY